MRKKILMAAAAAFVLSSVGAGVAVAQVSNSGVKSASEKKDPSVANTADAKVAAKGAKKAASTAKSKAKKAESKAKTASDKAADAAKDSAAASK